MTALALTVWLLVPSGQERQMLVGGELRVIVATLDGEPLSGAIVELFSWGDVQGIQEGACLSEPIAFATSDDRGYASLRLPQPGYYVLRSNLDGFVVAQLGPFLIDSLERPRTSVKVPLELRMNESVHN